MTRKYRHAARLFVMALLAPLVGAECAAATAAADVHALLDTLAPDDLAAASPRLDTVMNDLFPGTGEDSPCNDPSPWLSSTALCEWYAPGTRRDGLPDAFVSVSDAGIDSAVFWGNRPLDAKVWQCEIYKTWRAATICVPRTLAAERKRTLFREWRVTLAEITRPGDESAAPPHARDD